MVADEIENSSQNAFLRARFFICYCIRIYQVIGLTTIAFVWWSNRAKPLSVGLRRLIDMVGAPDDISEDGLVHMVHALLEENSRPEVQEVIHVQSRAHSYY